MSDTYIALLRGINLAGKNRLSMATLSRHFTDAACTEVATYIQSGNVVFRAEKGLARKACDAVQSAIAAEHGFNIPVILRSAAELAATVAGNPFLARNVAVESLHVVFLSDTPAATAVKDLDPDRSPPDSFVVRRREIYLCAPNGLGRTRLTNAWFDAKLRTVSTMRNWRTCLALLEMAKAI